MTDRVKESVFNILTPVLTDARVLDLYSGTGSLGIEALSRGAKSVQFVEKDVRSIRIIVENLETLKASDDAEIFKGDVVSFLKGYKMEPFDVILIDPPFKEMLGTPTLEALSQSKALSASTRVMIEHSSQEELTATYGTLKRVDVRDYGDKYISFYEFSV